MTPSHQQDQALQAIAKWLADPGAKQSFYLEGFAGSGKTTLAKHFAAGINSVCFAAFTGKASLVMRRKGCTGASTIHSLIYIAEHERGVFKFSLNPESAVKTADLVIIDECSMVGADREFNARAKVEAEAETFLKINDAFGTTLPWVPTTIDQYDRLNTPEARFIKTLDKVLPKITHALNKGAALREHGVQPGDIDASNGAQYAKIIASYGADQPEALALYQSVHEYLKSVLGCV